jgi:hypothetical protein
MPDQPRLLFRATYGQPRSKPFRLKVLRSFSGTFGSMPSILVSCFHDQTMRPSEGSCDAADFDVPLPACAFAVDRAENHVCGAVS